MHWITYIEPLFDGSEDGYCIVYMSENDVKRHYYPEWNKKMVKKFGEDKEYPFEECLTDYMIVHWAQFCDEPTLHP